VVARPVGDFGDMQYQTLKCNVDILRLIQLGLSFCDKEGNWVDGCTCWQFNFKFSLSGDMFAQDSIELLKTSGIDFEKFEELGIDVKYFGELMMMSGLVLTDDVKWLTFHAGYDFGYLLKTLTCSELPAEEADFLALLRTYFPSIYDVKYMMTAVEGLHGGLNSLADSLNIERIGPMHQAGSDSLLTAQTYFGLLDKHPATNDPKYCGELFGLGTNHTKYKSKNYNNNNNNNNNNNSSGGNNSNNNNNNNNNNGQHQLQYNSSVHYGTGNNGPQQGSTMQSSTSMSSFGYEEQY
jgi:CCR4-NOT transcription complex subunit 7/8